MHSVVNRRRARNVALIAFVILIAQAPAAAFNLNGFMREKGHGDVSLSYSMESYDEFWRGDTKVPTPGGLGEIETQALSMFVAYGVTNRVAVFAVLPYVQTEGDGTDMRDESDLQDLAIMGTYRFAQLGSRVKSSFVGGLGFSTPLTDYKAFEPVAIGDSTTDILFRFVYQLKVDNFYFSQNVGLNVRSQEAPDSYPLYTEIGYTWGRTTFNVFYDKVITEDGVDIGGPGFMVDGVPQFPYLREEVDRTGGKVYVRVSKQFGVSVFGFTVLDGRNTGKATGGALGATFNF